MKSKKGLLGLAVAAALIVVGAITRQANDEVSLNAGAVVGFSEALLQDDAVSTAINASAEQLAERVQEIAQTTPDTQENRDRIFADVNSALMMATLSNGLPPSSAPTVESITRDFYEKSFLKQKAEPSVVADWLRLEKQLRVNRVRNGEDAQSSNYTAALLLPYLEEAGLCGGDVVSAKGKICSYVDRAPGSARVKGNIVGDIGLEPTQLREPPADSDLAKILALSRESQPIRVSSKDKATAAALAALHGASSLLIANAHAAEPPPDFPTPGERIENAVNDASNTQLPSPESASTFNIEQCTDRDRTAETQTLVIKLDPWAIGLLLHDQIMGRIDVSGVLGSAENQSATRAAQKIAFNSLIKNVEKTGTQYLQDTVANRSNEFADREAKKRCMNHGLPGSSEYENCYASRYRNRVQIAEQLSAPLNFAAALTRRMVLEAYRWKTEPTGGFISQNGVDLVIAAIPKIVNVNVFSENYVLTNIHYGATSADQAFVIFPNAFSCMAEQCGRVAKCNTLHGDGVSCASRLATTQDWVIRKNGGYVEHSINTCNAQIMSFAGRAPYREIRRRETLGQSNGLPYDLKIKTSYQRPGSEHPDPNRCEPADTSASPTNTATDASNQRVEHLCPYPTSKRGPTDPPPPLGARTDSPSVPLLNGRPQEAVPVWSWSFDKIKTGKNDYSLIYAGLESTKTAYDTARKVPVTGDLLPDCSATRTFNGVVSDPGDAFWAWHGNSNENPYVNPETVLAGALAYGLSYKDLWNSPNQTQKALFIAGLGVTTALDAAHPAGKAYQCADSAFKFSSLCPQTDASRAKITYVGSGRNGDYPMPETNIILALKLNHEPVACGLNDTADRATKKLYLYGDEVKEGAQGQSSTIRFQLERSGSVTSEAQVDYLLKSGTATPGSDYTVHSGRVRFGVGEAVKVLSVSVIGDNVIEKDESFTLSVSNPSNIELYDTEATGTITDDDTPVPAEMPPPLMVVVQGADVTEEDNFVYGKPATFTIKRIGGTGSENLVFDYKTVAGTASEGLDYTATSGRVTLAPGVSQALVTVPVFGDYFVESAETLDLQVTLVSGATTLMPSVTPTKTVSGTSRIVDNDSAYTVTAAPASVTEGNVGDTLMRFVVTKAGSLDKATMVYASVYTPTTGATAATFNSDYRNPATTTLTFAPGQNRLEVVVPIIGELVKEMNESFTLQVVTPATEHNAGNYLVFYNYTTAIGTIVNDDR